MAGLTEHLMQCLQVTSPLVLAIVCTVCVYICSQELANSKKTIEQLTSALDKYKTKFAIIISQQVRC